MLKKLIPTSLGAVALALSLSFAAPTVANAGNLSFSISKGHGSVTFGNGHYKRNRHHTKRYRNCSPRDAVRKARHIGVRHAYVERVGHRFVIVEGRKRGKRVEVAFKRRSPHCSVAWFERSRRDYRDYRSGGRVTKHYGHKKSHKGGKRY